MMPETSKPSRPLNKRTQFFLLLTALISAWLGGLFWFTRSIVSMQPPPPAVLPALDAIVVLTGGSNRLETGFHLLEERRGKKMYISGVYRGVEVKELMQLLKEKKSEELECCIALGDAENTVENARESTLWLRQEGFGRFYLVTANYHMKRALMEFRSYAPQLKAVPYPVAPEKLSMESWWRNENFRSLIIREYSKYIVARLRTLVTL